MHVQTRGEIVGCIFDIGIDVLSTTLDPSTGTITAQLGDVTKGRADSDSAELWQGASGYISRPALPDQGKASCQVCTVKQADYDLAFCYRDLRATAIYANLAPGESCAYATTGMARQFYKKNGASFQYTTDDNTETGNSITAGVSAYYQGVDGQPHLGGEWRYSAPWGGAWHDATGYHLRTHHGVKVDAGGLVLPAPISATARTYSVDADIVTLKGTSVILGSPATAEPLVKALSMQALMGTFAADIEVLAKAVDAYATAVAAVPVVGTASATLAGAFEAFALANTGLMATIRVAAGTRAAGGS